MGTPGMELVSSCLLCDRLGEPSETPGGKGIESNADRTHCGTITCVAEPESSLGTVLTDFPGDESFDLARRESEDPTHFLCGLGNASGTPSAGEALHPTSIACGHMKQNPLGVARTYFMGDIQKFLDDAARDEEGKRLSNATRRIRGGARHLPRKADAAFQK